MSSSTAYDLGAKRPTATVAVDAARLLARLIGPPLVAFAAAQLAVMLGAILSGASALDGATYARWDSGLYLNIASRGYEAMPCPPQYGGAAQTCGNAGWFPLYPLTVGLGYHVFGLPLGAFALFVSLTCCVATLAALWILVLGARVTPGNLLALTFAAFCPAMVYTHGVFPMSMATLFLVLAFGALQRERVGLASLAGFGLAVTYPTGILLAPAAGLWLLLRNGRRRPRLADLRAVALVAAGPVLGFVTAVLVIGLQSEMIDAFFRTQQKYAHGLHPPWTLFAKTIGPLFDGGVGPLQILAVHEIVAALIVLLVVAGGLWRVRRDPPATLLVLFALVQFVVPLTQAGVSWYRGDTLLLPLAILVARLPVALGLPIAGIGVLMAVPMTQAFVTGILV